MLTSLALILLMGLGAAAVFDALRLPRIIGMLLTGILLGPCVLNALDPAILGISAELRQMALVIILLKAGLSLDLRDLRRVGRPAVLMSCLPAIVVPRMVRLMEEKRGTGKSIPQLILAGASCDGTLDGPGGPGPGIGVSRHPGVHSPGGGGGSGVRLGPGGAV